MPPKFDTFTAEESLEMQRAMASTMFDQMSEGMKRYGATDEEIAEVRAKADAWEAAGNDGSDVFSTWLLRKMGR